MEEKTENKSVKKQLTDADVKRKAVKLVVAHLKKKAAGGEFMGIDYLLDWVDEIEHLLKREEFDIREYHKMRKQFNDVIESTLDAEMRKKLRDSWYSMGKALDKKVKPY